MPQMLIQPKSLFDDLGIDIMHRVTATIFLSLIIVVNHDDNHDDIFYYRPTLAYS